MSAQGQVLAYIDALRAAYEKERRAAQELREQLAELDHSFELRWNADMRAIKRWQAATGKMLTWPDHADLCVWLMEQLEGVKK